MIRYVLSISLVLLTACQVSPEKNIELIDCPELRSQVCTKIYRPVCALDEQQQFTSYASKCTACSVEAVIAYRNGSCEPGKRLK